VLSADDALGRLLGGPRVPQLDNHTIPSRLLTKHNPSTCTFGGAKRRYQTQEFLVFVMVPLFDA